MHRAEQPELDAGATALAVVVVGGCLMVANAGDSRAVLSRKGRAIDLSRDHKPSGPAERERVRAAGAGWERKGAVGQRPCAGEHADAMFRRVA